MHRIRRKESSQGGEVFYPSHGPNGTAHPSSHTRLMADLYWALRDHFRERKDVYVIANCPLEYEEGNPDARCWPDVMMASGVDYKMDRAGFKIWEEKAGPCFVLELTSDETIDEDLGPKKVLYERLGVREYFLFDPMGECLSPPLIGYCLVSVGEDEEVNAQNRFMALPGSTDGGLDSGCLGLRVVPRGGGLLIVDPRTGTHLPTLEDMYREMRGSRGNANQVERP